MAKLFILKFVCTALLVALNVRGINNSHGSTLAVVSVERRDISSFYATQYLLQNMTNIFAADTYAASDGVPKLQGIANHIINCSDAFDSATIQFASIIQPGQFRPMLTPTDAATPSCPLPSEDHRPSSHTPRRGGLLRGGEQQPADAHCHVSLGRRPCAAERYFFSWRCLRPPRPRSTSRRFGHTFSPSRRRATKSSCRAPMASSAETSRAQRSGEIRAYTHCIFLGIQGRSLLVIRLLINCYAK
ncbi:hypothetical protein B0H11DRAFT_1196081 [Mycena galericulata]|nr:hypothetical protein B0H11DRAFT_1196081 [Mycena galericulata]